MHFITPIEPTSATGITCVLVFARATNRLHVVAYPTPKPLSLLGRILKVSSNKGDILNPHATDTDGALESPGIDIVSAVFELARAAWRG